MSTDTVQALVDEYVRRLQAALRDLPRDRRREIVDEIVSHVDAALAELPAHDEASVRTVLDRVGDPDDIAADARDRFGLAPPRPTALEPITIVLLLFGGFLCGVGWLAGVVLLWSDRLGRRARPPSARRARGDGVTSGTVPDVAPRGTDRPREVLHLPDGRSRRHERGPSTASERRTRNGETTCPWKASTRRARGSGSETRSRCTSAPGAGRAARSRGSRA